MSVPTRLKATSGTWLTSWYDEGGKRRFKRFGNTSKVKQADATNAYAAWLRTWHTDESVRHPDGLGFTVTDLVQRHMTWAEGYYRRRDGKPTGAAGQLDHATRKLAELCGTMNPNAITPRVLREVRDAMIADGLARNTINDRIRKVRGMFKWAVAEDLVDPSVWHGLQTLAPLKPGRSAATETDAVKPAPERGINTVLPLVPEPVAAMIRLQLLTGMRPGEVRIMRAIDLEMTGPVWRYRPEFHKTEHHGRLRIVHLGPQAQEVIRPFLVRDTIAYLFRSTHHAAKLPHYSKDAYGRAITRACERSGVPGWSPGQLRHNYGTMIRKRYGLETASVLCGHAKVETTQIYAEADLAKAESVAREVG